MTKMMRALGSLVASAAVFGGATAQSLPQDPYYRSVSAWGQGYEDQWALRRIGLDESAAGVWTREGDEPVIVAVIDSGVDWHHLDFDSDVFWRNPGETPGNGVDDDGNGYVDDVIGWDFIADHGKPWDFDGHGTMVAGVIAASWNDVGVAGVNPRAKIMVLKALNSFGNARASWIAEAVVYAADNGARVINISVGEKSASAIIHEAVRYAAEKGVLVVAAAGNESVDASAYGLAGFDEVMSVAASGVNNERLDFSNFGLTIDIAAPGIDVMGLRARRTDTMRVTENAQEYAPGSAYVGDDNRYYRAAGTSFAAPLVAGVASLVISRNPALTNKDVHRMLVNSAADIETPGVDQLTGYGLLDAKAALAADPAFFITPAVSHTRVRADGAGGQQLAVFGTAEADAFAGAALYLGAGDDPQEWTKAADISRSVARGGELGAIPAAAFAGSSVWTLRVVVMHKNGAEREARFRLTIG